jgi:hypothetical protein
MRSARCPIKRCYSSPGTPQLHYALFHALLLGVAHYNNGKYGAVHRRFDLTSERYHDAIRLPT